MKSSLIGYCGIRNGFVPVEERESSLLERLAELSISPQDKFPCANDTNREGASQTTANELSRGI
jgi:hypothetical protein